MQRCLQLSMHIVVIGDLGGIIFMIIITVLGDSLAMVRPDCGISYKKTYSYILNKLLCDAGVNSIVLNKARRANTIVNQTTVGNMSDEVENNNSDYFIIHIGIVDCAPRIFSQRARLFMNLMRALKMGFLVNGIIKLAGENRFVLTKYSPKVYVKKEVFEKKYNYLIQAIINNIQNTEIRNNIFVLNIADTTIENKRKSYGFEKNIDEYNLIISKIVEKYSPYCQLIDINKMTKLNQFYSLEDGIHITDECHKEIALIIYEKIMVNVKNRA